MATKEKEQTTTEQQPEFGIQRLYVKDFSFEGPNSPKIFLDEWKPEVSMDLNIDSNAIDSATHDVTLTVTITVKVKEKTAFLVEVKQAGIFTVKNFNQDQTEPMLQIFCPNLLYPYAREAITSAVAKGGFPQLYLAPVNFEALYQERSKRKVN